MNREEYDKLRLKRFKLRQFLTSETSQGHPWYHWQRADEARKWVLPEIEAIDKQLTPRADQWSEDWNQRAAKIRGNIRFYLQRKRFKSITLPDILSRIDEVFNGNKPT